MIKILLFTFFLNFSANASEPIFSELFDSYLDGPTLGADNSIYFSSGSKILSINENRQVELLFDFSKVNSYEKTPKIAGMTKTSNGNLLLADYKNQIVWCLPYINDEYRPEKLYPFVTNSKMKQPNDIDLFRNKYLVAADHNLGERKAGVWLYNIKKTTQEYFVKTGGKLTGVATNDDDIIVASALPCYVASYKMSVGSKATLNWKKKCTKDWSVDGIAIKDGRIYLTRIELGRIDVLSTNNGKLVTGYCLLRDKYFGKINESYTFNKSM